MGTFDISILEIGDNVIEVAATGGDTTLGGADIDELISSWIIDSFLKESGIDVSNDTMALSRVKEAAEKAKIELSSTTTTEINLPYLSADATGPKHFAKTLNRAQFENMIEFLVDRTITCCKDVLAKANVDNYSDIDEVILVGGSSRVPIVSRKLVELFGTEDKICKNVNPDEVVSMGAAIQGAVLAGDDSVGDLLLLDVTPTALSIETYGGVATHIIEGQTTIPTTAKQRFAPYMDNQPGVTLHVLQGDRAMAKDNKTLGMFELELDPATTHRNEECVEVEFTIDANGILTVTAKDIKTGKDKSITITGASGLSKEEVEKMKAEAEANAEADKKLLEQIQKRNNAEAIAYSIEKTLEEDNVKNNLTESEISDVKEKVNKVLEATKAQKDDEIDNLLKELTDVWYPLATKLNQMKPDDAKPAESADNVNESAKSSDAEDVTFEEV